MLAPVCYSGVVLHSNLLLDYTHLKNKNLVTEYIRLFAGWWFLLSMLE